MITIRKYVDIDFDLVGDLMIRNCEFDALTVPLLREKLYDDPDWETSATLVAETNDRICGFIMGVARQLNHTTYGYIKLMAVDAGKRRQGIAGKLFQSVETRLKSRGAVSIRIYDVPKNYLVPGIDPRYTEAVCFAYDMGFKKVGEAVNMRVRLEDRDWDTASRIRELSRSGIEIRRALPEDSSQLLQLIRKEWNLWEYEVYRAISNNPATVFIATKDGAVKAFAAYDGNNRGTGWFGPMGTHPELRGRGIGSVLLYLCLEDLKKSGLKEATIPWVDPVAFYAHYADARITRVFWRFEKQI